MREIQKSTERIFEGKVVNLRKDIATVNDMEVYREVVEHPGGVATLAITDEGKILCVEQFRYAQQREMLEIPAGKLERGEDPFETGKRELQEETGYKAEHWTFLGEFIPTGAYLEEKIWMYYATDLTYGKQHLDEDEFIEVKEYTMDEMIEMIINQKIIDGKTIAMTLKVKMMLEKGLLPYPKKFKK